MRLMSMSGFDAEGSSWSLCHSDELHRSACMQLHGSFSGALSSDALYILDVHTLQHSIYVRDPCLDKVENIHPLAAADARWGLRA